MIKDKSYFQNCPTGPQYTLFNQGNKPDKVAFADLFDSIPFKTNINDTATDSAQGLVRLMNDADAEVRAIPVVGLVSPVALAHQLPMLIVSGTTEILTGANASNGIKITGLEITSSGRKRLSYKLEFDPHTLATVTTMDPADFIVVDVSGAPKKIIPSNILKGAGIWSRSDITDPAIITPVETDDNLSLPLGKLTAAGIILNLWPVSTLNASDSVEKAGIALRFMGGNATAVSDPYVGGQIYVYGGLGCNGALHGDVQINYDGSISRGHLGIACPADVTYQVKIYGGLWVTGAIKIGLGGLPGGIEYLNYINTNGEFVAATPKTFMDKLLGATLSASAVAYFNGADWVKMDIPASTRKFFSLNGAGTLGWNDLVLTSILVNSDINANAGIVFTKMAAQTVDTIPQFNHAGFIESSGVSASTLSFIAGLTSDAQSQINAIKKNVMTSDVPLTTTTILTAAVMKDIFFLNTTGGGFTTTLPLISTLLDGQMVLFHQYGANTATIAKNVADNSFVDKSYADQATITVGGDGKWVLLRCRLADQKWYIVSMG